MEPTEEQIKELWEWCGLEVKLLWGYYDAETGYFKPNPTGEKTARDIEQEWCFRDGEQQLTWCEELPPIDLNNLSLYAIPKLIKDITTELEIHFDYLPNPDKWNCMLGDGFYEFGESKYNIKTASGDTPALALFWAIYSVIDKSPQ